MTTAVARKTSLENEHLRNCEYLVIITLYNVNEEPHNWIGLRAV